jgi:hypothetical protein
MHRFENFKYVILPGRPGKTAIAKANALTTELVKN